jgi:transposase-like protein
MRVVLSVLRGEATATDAARRVGVSEQTVHNWKRLFLDSGREGPGRSRASPSQRP